MPCERSFGKTRRSQTAYARSGSKRSAVTEFLSFRTYGEVSRFSTAGVVQWAPPSVERLIVIALVRSAFWSNASAMK